MHFDKSSSNDGAQKRKRLVFGLILVGLLVGIGVCVHIVRKSEKKVVRVMPDVSDLSVVFVNGEATLFWVDPPDSLLHHIEVLYWPGSKKPDNPAPKPENVAPKIEKHVISGLDNGKEYTFAVRAVDKWKNKSAITQCGSGKAFKQRNGNPIKGKPVAKQVTLSWTNLSEASYDFLEVSYYPDHETPVRVPRGVESKTLTGLTNGLEHTFTVKAVDSQGNRKSLNEIGIFIPDYATSPESVVGRSSAGQVTLKWSGSFGTDIRHLEVVYLPEGETPITIAKSAEMATITDLSDIIDYEFTVYAVNAAGRRQPVRNVRLSSWAIPVFNGRDAEQTVVKVQPVAGQVKLEWEDPEMADLNYIAIIYDPGDSDVPVIVEKGANTKTVVGLSDSRTYRFVVYGVDLANNNRVVTGVNFSTPRLPTLRVKPVGGKATLVWASPEDPNLDYVRIMCTPGRETPIPLTKRVEAYTFTNLSDHEEYEFKITAVNTKGNVYGVARANVIVAKIPVLTGKPVDRNLSLAWADPDTGDVRIEHIEIAYSSGMGDERTQSVVRGMETHTFTNLIDDVEYTFAIYGLDEVGNRHPVKSARIYDPRTAFLLSSNMTFQTGNVNALLWRAANNPSFGDSAVYALAFGITANGTNRWVAGGGDGKMAYSNDYGLNWTPVDDSTFGSFSINAISYGNGRWVAGGKSGRVAWSTNGTAWNSVKKTHFTTSQTINALAFGNGHWIAGGSNGIIILSDDNGATWRRITTTVFGKSAVNAIVFHEDRWMAAGGGGKIAYSEDNGLTWTAVENSSFGNAAISAIVYDKKRWMAGGYAQSTAYSDDGITWQPLPRPFYILCMGFNGSRWVVGGQEGRLAWSSDSGKNWVIDELGHNLFGDNWVQAIASGMSPSGKRRWLSGGQSGKIIFADEP